MKYKFLPNGPGCYYYVAAGVPGVGAYARDDDEARMLLLEVFRAQDAKACLADWKRLGYRVRLEQ